MKITKKVEDVINKQINHELHAAYLYLSMSAYFSSENLNGMANWMKLQAQEEVEHAMKLYDYLQSRAGTVVLTTLDAPRTNWNSALEAFEDAYKHELKVTDLIHGMIDVASSEKDRATISMLQWFVDEQVEEEDSALAIVEKLKLVKDNKGALFMLDRELGARQKD